MYLYSQAELTASRQPASISTYAVHAPSTSPPWDRGLLKYSSSSPPPAASLLTTSPSPVTMAQLVNQQMVILPAGANPNGKDSRWLTLEVCREYQRSKCSRSDNECKFAHPPAHVEVQNGRVVACFDSIKGKCQRKDPPCKYLHPPQHLREQLLQNGRNNLILKNLQLQAFHQQAQYGVLPVQTQVKQIPAGTKTVAVPTVIPGQFSYLTHYPGLQTLSAVPAQPPTTGYNPFITTSLASVAMQPNAADATSVMTQSMIPATAKAVRADKFESTSENGDPVTSHASLMDTFSFPYIPQPTSAATLPHQLVLAKKRPRDPTEDLLLSTLPGMIPAYKRIAVGDISKGGYPVYQTNPLMSPLQPASLMQLQQPAPYIPMSCEYAMYATYLYPTDSAHVQPTLLAPALGPTLMPSTTPSTTTSSSVSTAAVSTVASMTVNNHSGHSIIATTTTAPPSSMYLPANLSSSGAVRLPTVPNNAYYVEYFGSNKQLRDTLPVCQDFKCGQCNSPYCKQVHLSEDYVEVNNGYVTVCRDYATRQSCKRSRCKYYHIPIDLPPS